MNTPFDSNKLMDKKNQVLLEEDVKKALIEIQAVLRKYNLNLTAELVYLPNGIMPKPVFNRQNYVRNNSNNNFAAHIDKVMDAEKDGEDGGKSDSQDQTNA